MYVGKELQQQQNRLFQRLPYYSLNREAHLMLWGADSLGAWRVGVEDHLCPAAHGEDLLQTVLPAPTQWEPGVAVGLVAITPLGTGKGTPGC